MLGRDDPISFALKLTRSHNPGIWKALDDLGVGKLVVQAGRERDFANLYRANDAARRLTDFAHVLKFVGAAFDIAVGFHGAFSPVPGGKRQQRIELPDGQGEAGAIDLKTWRKP